MELVIAVILVIILFVKINSDKEANIKCFSLKRRNECPKSAKIKRGAF